MQHRIYIVGHGQEIRLIRATHKAQALAHVARSIINVKVATQDELVITVSRGIPVENVVDPDQTTLVE
jgi:hypothetical protein